ncbi:Phospholipid-transporting ATPase 1 [Hordeum vulgare]|nr:Phospholipid-transporting ATPase 1 [Hordeum vulgare]
MATISTDSSMFPQMVLPESLRGSVTHPIPGFHVYSQASRLCVECSTEVSVVAPSTHATAPIDLNSTPVAGAYSFGGTRKREREMRADMLLGARNLFDTMTAATADETTNRFMESIIFEGRPGLGGFPLDHEFPEDHDLEEEDELDIDGEPLFKEELANQANGSKPKRQSKRTEAYTTTKDKFLCECWKDIGQDPEAFQALKAFKVQHEGKSFNLSHCWRVINEKEKVKEQYAAFMANGGKKDKEEVVDGEKTHPRGKTNSNKKDKQDTGCNALVATMKGMMTKKDSREEKRRKDKEDHVNAFMETQKRSLEMEAEKQARILEMEAVKQARILEIEAADAKTKTKEVALASIMTGVEIMKMDLNTLSLRKRPWFEKMHVNMLKFDEDTSMAACVILFCMPASVLA